MSHAPPPPPKPEAAAEAEARARVFTTLLGVILCLQSFGISITLPALPAIGDALRADAASVQLTVGAYMAGVAGTQLVYGVLSDRFGRRPVLLAGIALHALAGLGCALADHIGVLVALRALQGVGAAAAAVLGRTMIRDLFEGPRAVRMLSLMGAMMSIVPLLAPLFGGWLLAGASAWGAFEPWRVVYGTVAVASMLTWLASQRYLRESIRQRDPTATDPRRLIANCRHFLSLPGSAALAGTQAFGAGGMFSYSATAALVFIKVFGVDSSHFGWILAITGMALIAGSVCASRWATRYSVRRLLDVSTLAALVAGLMVLGLCLSDLRGPWAIALVLAPMVVYAFAQAPMSSSALATALHPVPHIAGVATALCGSLQMGAAAVMVWWGGRLFDGTPSALGYCVCTGATLSFLCYRLGARAHVPTHRPGH